jgi:hypothetical protein
MHARTHAVCVLWYVYTCTCVYRYVGSRLGVDWWSTLTMMRFVFIDGGGPAGRGTRTSLECVVGQPLCCTPAMQRMLIIKATLSQSRRVDVDCASPIFCTAAHET